MQFIAVITTTATLVEAQQIARRLVEQKLVACAQISQIESFYGWEGSVQQEPEYRIFCKTTLFNYSAIEDQIKQIHTYDLPAIYALPLDPIYGPFGNWIEDYTCSATERNL